MGTSANGDYGVDSKRLQTLLAWVCASFGMGLLVVPSASAEPVFRGDIELFRALAMAQRDNAERISSWQGSSRVEVTRSDPNGILLRDTSAYHFIYAREHNATRWNWTPEDRYTRKGGKLVADPLEDKKLNEMRKGDAFYKYDLGVETKEGEKRGALVIWPVQKAEEGAYSYSFDPMWYLTGEWTGWDDMATGLMEYYRMANDPNFTSSFARYSLTRDGPIVTLDGENPTADMASRYVFDLSKGGTLARYHATMKRNVQSIEWTYEEKDGLWIPKTCTKIIDWDPPKRDGCTKYTITVTFIESTLNHPVPASEFSLEKLGVTVGTRVSDHLTGLFYLYGGSEKLGLEDEDLLPKEKSAVQGEASVQDAMESESKQPTDEQRAPDDVLSKPVAVRQVGQTGDSNRTAYLIGGLLAFVVVGVVSFMLVRKGRKAGVKP
jgi:hypothetical protein